MGIKLGKKETIIKGKSTVTVGTVDKYSNKSMFMNVSFWVQPKENTSYSKFNKIISSAMSKAISHRFGNVNIIDVVCKESSFNPNKKSFITISNVIYSRDDFKTIKNKLLEACDEFNSTMAEYDGELIEISLDK